LQAVKTRYEERCLGVPKGATRLKIVHILVSLPKAPISHYSESKIKIPGGKG